MTIQHAPAPWRKGARVPERHAIRILDRYGLLVAEARAGGGPWSWAEANAHLIAAAPDSLKAAEDALTWWHSIPSHIEAKEPSWVAECRAAIAKAIPK